MFSRLRRVSFAVQVGTALVVGVLLGLLARSIGTAPARSSTVSWSPAPTRTG